MTRPLLCAANFDSLEVPEFLAEVLSHPLMDPLRDVTIARAPGRLDLMGGIADYSGSLVLQWPLREAALAAVQIVPDGHLHVTSLGRRSVEDRSFSATVDALFPNRTP